jgi:hypothetical protein
MIDQLDQRSRGVVAVKTSGPVPVFFGFLGDGHVVREEIAMPTLYIPFVVHN